MVNMEGRLGRYLWNAAKELFLANLPHSDDHFQINLNYHSYYYTTSQV